MTLDQWEKMRIYAFLQGRAEQGLLATENGQRRDLTDVTNAANSLGFKIKGQEIDPDQMQELVESMEDDKDYKLVYKVQVVRGKPTIKQVRIQFVNHMYLSTYGNNWITQASNVFMTEAEALQDWCDRTNSQIEKLQAGVVVAKQMLGASSA